MKETTKPKVIKLDDHVDQPLITSYLGCEHCGRELNPDYKYCPECGRRILWEEE